jgi:thioester reductase-like protein
MSDAVLLTGATGFVGMEVLARYLERSDRRVIALIRAEHDRAAEERLQAVLGNLFGRGAARHRGRVRALAADLTAPGLGLSPARRERLAAEVGTVIHGAASVSFTMPIEQARAINVEGTRAMLELASLAQRRGGLERYAHISTAYVAGTHCGRFGEGDHDVGQGFHNAYERSKFEAERLVRSWPALPFTILRPSIVVGDRRSGWTSAFNVLYWPLRAFARGLFEAVPAVPSAPVDVVSVDYVADAIYALCEGPGGVGETYHLTAGENASTIGEIAQLASRYFRRPLPKVYTPSEFAALSAVQRQAIEGSSAYFPYFSIGAVFDASGARARLEPAGISSSPLREYLERLLDFATRSRWGKRPIARAEALVGWPPRALAGIPASGASVLPGAAARLPPAGG